MIYLEVEPLIEVRDSAVNSVAMPKTVLVDFEGALDSYTGVPICTKNDVVALNNAGFKTILWFSSSNPDSVGRINKWLSDEVRLIDKSNVILLDSRPRNLYLWILQLLRFPLRVPKVDFFYCVLFPGVRLRSKAQRIIRVHDPYSQSKNRLGSFIESPARIRLRIAKILRMDAFLSVFSKSILVANSKWTVRRLLSAHGIPEEKFSVIYNLLQFDEKQGQLVTPPKPYFIFVGGQRQRKDPISIIEVWASSQVSQQADLIIVGDVPIERLSIKVREMLQLSNLRIVKNLSSGELKTLIVNSVGTIFMSYGEGWGLPIAESLVCGRRVICNDLEVFREVAENWAYYFPTHSPIQAVTLMKLLISETKVDQTTRASVLEFSKRYRVDQLSHKWREVLLD